LDLIKVIAAELAQPAALIENTVRLIDEGNTIPFIARYRKEATGGMSDEVLRRLDERLRYLRNLEERKEEVRKLIEEQGKLTPELAAEIEKAEVLQRVEDLYKPFRQKRTTRAGKARAKGLEPLAAILRAQEARRGTPEEFAAPFVDPEKEVADVTEALQGACDIIAEDVADDPDLTADLREKTFARGRLASEAADPEEKTVYDMYYGKEEALSRIPNHRILAINRGEKEGKLKVRVEADEEALLRVIERSVLRGDSIFRALLETTIRDAYKRLIQPALEREMRSRLTERAQEEAIQVFAKNTEKLLMVPPVRGKRLISIDPGYRTGCKVAVLDETGRLLAYTTIYPTAPKRDVAGTCRTLAKLADRYQTDVIVIGNGTASRETEEVVSDFIRDYEKSSGRHLVYTIVNEAGASVYSASKLASEEYPDLDVTTRGAMSLGRRLQDPLAELVKIDPKHIGVGQYQHDMDQKRLTEALTGVVESCVNRVGVDLNTASPSLLSYIAGINSSIAKNIVSYREEHGRFTNRRELLKVAKLGPKAYEQCAGFLRIAGGTEPLDQTAVHPESYPAAHAMMDRLGIDGATIAHGGAAELDLRLMAAYPRLSNKERQQKLAAEIGVGVPTLVDMIAELKKPGRDPREDAPAPVFRQDVRSFEDLKAGQEMNGTVRNVGDFGAFVDIGVKQDGLVHISQMSDKRVKHPMDVVAIGDTVRVRILAIDREKGRISLTMKL